MVFYHKCPEISSMPLGGLGDETDVEQLVDDDRKRHVAEVAYYKAEARGFELGHELEDWLTAEQEVM